MKFTSSRKSFIIETYRCFLFSKDIACKKENVFPQSAVLRPKFELWNSISKISRIYKEELFETVFLNWPSCKLSSGFSAVSLWIFIRLNTHVLSYRSRVLTDNTTKPAVLTMQKSNKAIDVERSIGGEITRD